MYTESWLRFDGAESRALKKSYSRGFLRWRLRTVIVLSVFPRIALLRRDESGVVALEFALIALPFFMLVIGLLEVSLMYASAVALEGGTVASARGIRTGEVQQAADPELAFRTTLCDKVSALIPCESLQYEVIHPPGNTFDDAEGMPPEFDEDGALQSQGFDAGGISDVVVIRTSYRYHFITPFLSPLLSAASDAGVTMMSTITLRTEPYDFED